MSGSSLARVRNIADLRILAKRRVPKFSFEYVDGGSDDEVTLHDNRSVFNRCKIIPRQLTGLRVPDMAVTVLGQRSALPLAIAPTGYNGMLAKNGDIALARVAKQAGIPFTQSTMSSSSIEEVAAVMQGGRHWFQLYMLNDIAITERLLERAEIAGCEAIVLTTDAIAVGNREGDKHNFCGPGKLTLKAKLNVASKLGWLFDVIIPNGPPGFGNLTEFLPKGQASAIDGARFISAQMDQGISWKTVEWLRNRWSGKLLIKGVLHPQDAVNAADHGADAIVLTNHGGRQLDGAPATLEMLPLINEALAGRCEILIDSGFRRGSDVFKAIALGAKTAVCGRAMLYGLAAGGQAGAQKSLDILSSELQRTMMLAGYDRLTSIDSNCLLTR